MRWDNLRLDVVPQDARLTRPLLEQGAVVRTFDTPEFQGMTFYEVRARSIINKVPESSYVPFRYTINPYRGCSHACAYCVRGDTPILMADGRTKAIAEVLLATESTARSRAVTIVDTSLQTYWHSGRQQNKPTGSPLKTERNWWQAGITDSCPIVGGSTSLALNKAELGDPI